LYRFDTAHECARRTDGQRDERTAGQTLRPWLRRAKHSAIARKNCLNWQMRLKKFQSFQSNLFLRLFVIKCLLK